MKIDNIEVLKSVLMASFYDESAWRIVEGPMPSTISLRRPVSWIQARFKQLIIRKLHSSGFVLMRRCPYVVSYRDGGLDWPFFGYTMIGKRRLDNIEFCLETILKDDVPGDIIETGVWRGGATILMKAILDKHGSKGRFVWCADSFEGLPSPNEMDVSIDAASDFSDREFLAVSLEKVQANFARFGLLDENVKFLKGWFSETLPTAPIERLALIRLDGDLYESTMDALVNLYPKLSSGGFLIVDDYASWKGCRQAIDDYRSSHGITAELQRIDNHASFWRVP